MEVTQHRHHQQPRIVIVPTPGMSHLIALAVFAKQLAYRHNFTITFFIPSDGTSMTSQKTLVKTLPSAISATFLPPVNFDDLPPNHTAETRISLSLIRSLPALRQELQLLLQYSPPVAAMVVDIFGTPAFNIAAEFSVPAYIFNLTSAMTLMLAIHVPVLDQTFTSEFRVLLDPVKLPGCVPLWGSDFPDPLLDRKSETYQMFLALVKSIQSAAGILVNSFVQLESGAFNALLTGALAPPVFPVGPLTLAETGEDDNSSECLKWLEEQPCKSVLFVCFGSGGTLSQKQLTELAHGLELSNQRFIWVVRSPNEGASNANYFDPKSSKDPTEFLPEGFIERTKRVGLVVPSWAPQFPILAHESTGGFLSHCGWNSILESIVNGVPLIAWPLYAEQKMNAVLMTERLKVAVKVEVSGDGVVGREKVAEYVKGLVEGEEGKGMRMKMRELKEAAKLALGENGSSTKALGHVAEIWRNGL